MVEHKMGQTISNFEWVRDLVPDAPTWVQEQIAFALDVATDTIAQQTAAMQKLLDECKVQEEEIQWQSQAISRYGWREATMRKKYERPWVYHFWDAVVLGIAVAHLLEGKQERKRNQLRLWGYIV